MKKQNKHVIAIVQDGSIAQELELVPGDILLTVNGQPVEDIFDYRYLMNEEFVVLEVEKVNGEIWELEVEKEYEEDLGITFDKDLMDDYCTWLFNILFELQKQLTMPELSNFQGRFYGRVSEIIFNVWLDYQLQSGKI